MPFGDTMSILEVSVKDIDWAAKDMGTTEFIMINQIQDQNSSGKSLPRYNSGRQL